MPRFDLCRLLAWFTTATLVLTVSAPAAQSLPYTGVVQVQPGFFLPAPLLRALPGGTGSGSGGGFLNATGSIGGTLTLVNGPTPNGGSVTSVPPTGPQILYQATVGSLTCPSFPCVSPMLGDVRVGIFGMVGAPLVNLSVPLVAVGATTGVTAMLSNTVNDIFVTVTGLGAWTPGMVTITTTPTNTPMTNMNFATGSDARTPGGVGAITLVSPVLVKTNLNASPQLPLFGIVTLYFTPEPGTLLLLGYGVVGLATLGRRRLRA